MHPTLLLLFYWQCLAKQGRLAATWCIRASLILLSQSTKQLATSASYRYGRVLHSYSDDHETVHYLRMMINSFSKIFFRPIRGNWILYHSTPDNIEIWLFYNFILQWLKTKASAESFLMHSASFSGTMSSKKKKKTWNQINTLRRTTFHCKYRLQKKIWGSLTRFQNLSYLKYFYLAIIWNHPRQTNENNSRSAVSEIQYMDLLN